MKHYIVAILIVAVSLGCSTWTPAQKSAVLTDALTLANIAGTAAANAYGGPAAGQIASAGLSAAGVVLQAYVGQQVPASVVKATPGVPELGNALAAVISSKAVVTQKDVAIVDKAAAIVAHSP